MGDRQYRWSTGGFDLANCLTSCTDPAYRVRANVLMSR